MRVLAMVLGVVVMGAIGFAGCAEVVPPVAADAGADQFDSRAPSLDSSRGDSLAPIDPQRLVRGPQTYTGTDGASVSVTDGWKDTKRNEVCAPFLSTDGEVRCLPLEGAVEYRKANESAQAYVDAACSPASKATLVPSSVKAPPKFMRVAYEGVETAYSVNAIAKTALREHYVFDFCVTRGPDGGFTGDAAGPTCNVCRKVTTPVGTDVYNTTDEVRPADFAEFAVY